MERKVIPLDEDENPRHQHQLISLREMSRRNSDNENNNNDRNNSRIIRDMQSSFVEADGPQHDPKTGAHFSFRALGVGLVIGTLLCFSNMYFALQSGWVTFGSLQSTLLGFAVFKLFQRVKIFGFDRFWDQLSPWENVLIQTTAVSAATMPVAGGYSGIIPALASLPETPFAQSFGNLIWWGIALAFFGVFFAVPLRRQTILREKLKFPSGTATAQMIKMLHHMDETALPNFDDVQETENPGTTPHPSSHDFSPVSRRELPITPFGEESSRQSGFVGSDIPEDQEEEEQRDLALYTRKDQNKKVGEQNTHTHHTTDITHDKTNNRPPQSNASSRHSQLSNNSREFELDSEYEIEMVRTSSISPDHTIYHAKQVRVFLISFGASSFFSLLTYYLPVLANIPIFSWIGLSFFTNYYWTLFLSLSYVGQGMIMGIRTGVSLLIGSLAAWVFIGPIADATNLTNEDNPVSRFLLWIALALMLSESLTSL